MSIENGGSRLPTLAKIPYFHPPIVGMQRFVGHEQFFFSMAHGFQPVAVYTTVHQEAFNRFGASPRQLPIVFSGTGCVRMADYLESIIRETVFLQCGL